MKRIYDKPETFIHLLEPFRLLNSSQEEDGIRVRMSGYQTDSSFPDENEDGEDDGWE